MSIFIRKLPNGKRDNNIHHPPNCFCTLTFPYPVTHPPNGSCYFELNIFPYHFLFLVSFYSHLPAYEDETDSVFRNVGI